MSRFGEWVQIKDIVFTERSYMYCRYAIILIIILISITMWLLHVTIIKSMITTAKPRVQSPLFLWPLYFTCLMVVTDPVPPVLGRWQIQGACIWELDRGNKYHIYFIKYVDLVWFIVNLYYILLFHIEPQHVYWEYMRNIAI